MKEYENVWIYSSTADGLQRDNSPDHSGLGSGGRYMWYDELSIRMMGGISIELKKEIIEGLKNKNEDKNNKKTKLVYV
ncbi:MAG: hypothetical protein KatS3mg027_2467 [Bacteroidia bacterium]|nr:MAG: hypothetical protein KatS3mg027_2467 [Bacteroidia bacterium]